MHLDGSPEFTRRSVENALRLIGGKGRIHQFEPARKDPKVDIEVTLGAITEYVETGDIGAIALSEVSANTIRRAAKVATIAAVEIELSLWSTEAIEDGVLQTCAELDIPVLAYGKSARAQYAHVHTHRPVYSRNYVFSRTLAPLGRGILTGKVKSLSDIPEGDFRRSLPRYKPDVFDANLRLVSEVEKLAASKGCTPAQIAINWILALSRRPGMPKIIPIPGAGSPERVRENAVELELTDEDMAEIDRIVRQFAPIGERYDAHGMAMVDKS